MYYLSVYIEIAKDLIKNNFVVFAILFEIFRYKWILVIDC